MNDGGRPRLGLALLVAGLAAAGAGLGWLLAAGPDATALEATARQVRVRSQQALAAAARTLEPRVVEAAQLPELVAALDAQVDDKTLQDLIDDEESWASVRRTFPLQIVFSGERTLARSGPPAQPPALPPLFEKARLSGAASGLVPAGEGAYLVAAAAIDHASRITADRPVLLLGEPAGDGLLERLAPGAGGALALSNGRRLLATAGPASLRGGLAALAGQEGQGLRPLSGGTWAAAVPAAPGLWLWQTFAGAPGGVPPATGVLLVLAAFLAAGGLVMVIAARRTPAAPPEPDALAIHHLPTLVGMPASPAAPAPASRPAPAPTGGEARSPHTPALAVAVLPPTTPTEMGRYRLLKPIGEGGMAEVYIAEAHGPEGFKRHFVVKRLHPHLAARKEVVSQFIDEARLQARLLHSNIVPVFDFGRTGEEYFLALEYVHGRDLEKLTQRHLQATGHGLPAPLVFFVLHEVLEALAYAHNRAGPAGEVLSIVHRDVSPANVLLSYLGDVKLSDFGIVKAAGRVSKTDERVVKGNVSFMSPEQARGESVDHRSDLFSAGMVMFYCLTGRTLYSGESTINQLVRAAVGPVTEQFRQLADLPPQAGTILGKALALDPAERFQSAAEFARALRSLGTAGKTDLAGLMHGYYAGEIETDY